MKLTRICASKGCAWSLKPLGYPLRYSREISFFNLSYLASSRAVNLSNLLISITFETKTISWRTFLFHFERKGCLKRTSCLEVSSIASLQICRNNHFWDKFAKQTNYHFSAKIKYEPNLTTSEGKIRFGQIFFENDPLDEPKKMPPSKSSIFSGSRSKTQNGDQNRIYPGSLTLQTAKWFPLKRVLKNQWWKLIFVTTIV